MARLHPNRGRSDSEAEDRKEPAPETGPRKKTPLDQLGEEPDPRFTFANERTFLAWSRTSLALIAAGLAAAQLLHFGIGGVRLIIAIPLIAIGGFAAIVSYRQWEDNERRLRLRMPLSYSSLGRLVAVGISVIGVVAGIIVIIDLALK